MSREGAGETTVNGGPLISGGEGKKSSISKYLSCAVLRLQ